ncbi:MAG: SUMF1/EgtB/PvdO family nonheme iron enzyme [Myxococcales bacterium]|nr:SUMF1/EgtB/PvdO family nonheme iron enzyme [Myxococcales bacterium]
MGEAAGALIDDTALGEYQIVRPLGRGGMGLVFLGHDPVLDRPVAIKLIATAAPSTAARERFLIEARAIARLAHPNVVAVYRAGETRDGRPFLVQELVRGHSLDRLTPPLAPAEVRRIGVEIARGLAAAHRKGVLHRDLKPANVMIADDGTVKLLDFGLAKLRPLDQRGVAIAEAPAPLADATPSTRDGRRRAPDVDAVAVTADAPPPSPAPTAAAPAPVAETAGVPLAATPGSPDTVEAPVALTQTGAVLGTPRYMAPEQWRGEPATERTDVYALGAVLFELASGRPVHPTRDLDELRAAVLDGDAPPLASVAPEIDAALAAVIDRALARDPAARPASADALALALATASDGATPARVDNPYRGLAAFGAEDRALFFGRGADVGAIVDRLRSEQAVVVVGDSGVGKSSLVRAGVLPAIAAGGLGGERAWATATMRPGADPLAAAAAALDGDGGFEARLTAATGGGGGLVLFVDQAEELITQSARAVAARFADALVAALARDPGLRVIASVRGDFVTRLAEVPGLAALVTRGLQLVSPLDDAGRREAIVGPAQVAGVEFEPAAVDALCADSAGRGGLPLLQFALTLLWQRRDVAAARITAADVAAIGGVAGALARHADGVIAALDPRGRELARRILTGLVTADGTTAVRDAGELALRGAGAEAALAALIDGRLIVARDGRDGASYALAHDALIAHWSTLAGWLADDVGLRARRQRLAAAAAEWERLGRGRDGLLVGRPLAEAAELDDLPAREVALIAASRRAIRRRRALGVALAGLALAAVAAVWLGTRWANQRARDREVARRLVRADELDVEATRQHAALLAARADAFAAFDRAYTTFLDEDDRRADDAWAIAEAQAAALRQTYRKGASAIEAALLLGATPALRRRMAEHLADQADLADLEHDTAARDDLRERTATYDAALAARWTAPATLTVALPAPARIVVRCRVDAAPRRTLGLPVFDATVASAVVEVPPTTCLVEVTGPDTVDVRAPVALAPGEHRTMALPLPPRAAQPSGFVFVPAGRFLYGAPQGNSIRRTIAAPPQHAVELPAFWIARTEVTMDDYIAYLERLAPDARAERRPRSAAGFAGGLELERDPDGVWVIVFSHAEVTYRVRHDQRFRYQGRAARVEQDWGRFPVAGVTIADARAYAAWLDASGRVAGARLCTDAEWERAARGADDRTYPHGDQLDDDDANRDRTYGQVPTAFGPDEVGSHPASDSVFGVADLTGNVWEFVDSPPHAIILRGGGWYQGNMSLWATNRWAGEPQLRDVLTGIRLCASAR